MAIERLCRLSCDACFSTFEGLYPSTTHALDAAKRKGWIHLPRRGAVSDAMHPRHLCPSCVLNEGNHRWEHPFVNHPHGRRRRHPTRHMQCAVCKQWGTVMTIATECPGPVNSV